MYDADYENEVLGVLRVRSRSLSSFVLVSDVWYVDETLNLFEHHDREQRDRLLYQLKLDRSRPCSLLRNADGNLRHCGVSFHELLHAILQHLG